MGVMQDLRPVDSGQLVLTPHPVTLEGQRFIPMDLVEGETLESFLGRHVDLDADAWEVKIGGVVVPCEHWHLVKPKHGHLIEVRGAVNEEALYIIAMIALTYFTAGIASGAIWGGVTVAGIGGAALAGAVFMVGSMLINKVLGPKLDQPSAQDRESVYNLAGARNSVRPYEPLGLLFGETRIAPDILSQPYACYQGNEQYMGMVLTPGINVAGFDELYFGDTLLSSYEGVQVWTRGFPDMPQQDIPLYSNADTIAGGELSSAEWVTRVTSPDTVMVMVNLEYLLGGVGTNGKKYSVAEQVEAYYRPAGSTGGWSLLNDRRYTSNKLEQKRDTLRGMVPRGQYEVRVRITGIGNQTNPDNAHENNFSFTTMTSVQADDTDYRGIPRIGLQMKATGQLNGAPDQIRGVMRAKAMPIWAGGNWGSATTRATGLSNPGAQILAYARGFTDEDGVIIGGMGLPDGMIDIAALQAFMVHCTANEYTYDHWLQSARSHTEVLDTIALAGFGQITWAGGRLSVVWAADGQPLTGVVNMATMKNGQFQVDYTLANAADGVEYTYFDREDLTTKTLRVAAPGVVTMLNPAKLSGEGISSEDHAAEMARYHLAQSLYQYKDISYSTDLEHMTYKRLSVLALQHDMTKWAHGGRVVSAVNNGGTVTLTLDEPVPAPASGNAYMGLRIPGESVYRVLRVASFGGESNVITLADPWPGDADLPGDSDENPAHDTIWIYDFKSTPGYRVRVVSIEPESGLKGARIAVVPETPDFWTYVKTGEYIPPVTPPQFPDRPVASNLAISETQVVQGNTVFTELTATFDVDGYVDHCVVYAALPDQPLEEVAQTVTRTATWRIDDPGEYAIVVRPYDADGNVGVAVSGVYVTVQADTPPPVFDWLLVTELSGGVREYSWGYLDGTMQPANLAGAEIRYSTNTFDPEWETMTPLAEDGGYFTSAVEMVMPPSGTYTFAIRARNTSGILSDGILTIVRTLQGNLGEIIDTWDSALFEATESIAQEIIDRAAGDDAEALAREAAVTQLRAEVDYQAAKTWNFVADHNGFTVNNGTLSILSAANFAATRITAVTLDPHFITPLIDGLEGKQATVVRVMLRRTGAWQGRMYWATGTHSFTELYAVNASGDAPAAGVWTVVEFVTTAATDWISNLITQLRFDFGNAVASTVDVRWVAIGSQGSVPASGYAAKALETRIVDVDGRLTTTSSDVTLLRSVLRGELVAGQNLLSNPSGKWGVAPWVNVAGSAMASLTANAEPGNYFLDAQALGGPSIYNFYQDVINPGFQGKQVTFSVEVYIPVAAVGTYGIDTIAVASSTGTGLVNTTPVTTPLRNQWVLLTVVSPVYSGDIYDTVRCRILGYGGANFTQLAWRNAKLEIGAVRTAFSDDVAYSSATQLLQTSATRLTDGQQILMASYSLALDVNGYITGWQFNNDGTTGELTIVADKFRLVTPGSAPKTPFAVDAANMYLNVDLHMGAGRVISRDGGFMLVTGIGFGVGNEFVEWFGPEIPLHMCARGNAISYKTKTGRAYYKQIFTGARTFSQYTTLAVSGSTVQINVTETAGGTIVVDIGYAYSIGYRPGHVSQKLGPGPGTSAAQLRLYRKIGEGAETLVGTYSYSGGVQHINEAGVDVVAYVTGESTYNDTSGGYAEKRFRIEVVTATLQQVIVTGGSASPPFITLAGAGNLSIQSSE